MRLTALFATVAFLIAGFAPAATVYTDEAEFLAALSGPFFLEEFDGYTYGSYSEASLVLGPDANGFSCTITPWPEGDLLYSGDGNMSTNRAGDALRATFTGTPVYATGGWFFAGNISGDYINQPVIITLSDGTVHQFTPANTTTFRGFIADVPLTFINIEAPTDPATAWPTMDHFYGDAPPKATVAVLADPLAGGTVSGGGVYDIGETVMVTANPAYGWEFLHWLVNGSEIIDNPYTFEVTEDITLTAVFQPQQIEAIPATGTVGLLLLLALLAGAGVVVLRRM